MLNIEFKYIVLLFGIVSFSVCSRGDKVSNFTIPFHEFWYTNELGPGKKIPVLREGAISYAEIEDLYITDVSLISIEPGAFKNLPNLTFLKIHQNPDLTEIKTGVFNTVTSLTRLKLIRNGIYKIASDAFDNMPNLKEINLASNKIHEINPEWFANTPALNTFNISDNQIEEIPANAFKNFQNKDKLNIDLYYNNLKHVDDDAFKGLKKIFYLRLRLNNRTTINWNIFTGLDIGFLGLPSNMIKYLNEEDLNKISGSTHTVLLLEDPCEEECLEKILKNRTIT